LVALPNQEKIGFLHQRLFAAIGARIPINKEIQLKKSFLEFDSFLTLKFLSSQKFKK